MKILFIDHDDSFSNNIISFFRSKKCRVDVINHIVLKNTQPIKNIDQYHIVILSPGPGSTKDYPHTIRFYLNLPETIFVFGICLGHQLMLAAHGGMIKKICKKPVHGRQVYMTQIINSKKLGKFRFIGTCVLYNSLGCLITDSVFEKWNTLLSDNQICLMTEHKLKPHFGVQFHPESFASSTGNTVLKRVIKASKI